VYGLYVLSQPASRARPALLAPLLPAERCLKRRTSPALGVAGRWPRRVRRAAPRTPRATR